jgi:hypothetical protein
MNVQGTDDNDNDLIAQPGRQGGRAVSRFRGLADPMGSLIPIGFYRGVQSNRSNNQGANTISET